MRRTRPILAIFGLALLLSATGCQDDAANSGYRNAVTGAFITGTDSTTQPTSSTSNYTCSAKVLVMNASGQLVEATAVYGRDPAYPSVPYTRFVIDILVSGGSGNYQVYGMPNPQRIAASVAVAEYRSGAASVDYVAGTEYRQLSVTAVDALNPTQGVVCRISLRVVRAS